MSDASEPIGRRGGRALRTMCLASAAALAAGLAASAARAADDVSRQLAVLDRFVGTWDVTQRIRQPKEQVLRYAQTSTWAPGRKLLRGETSLRSDQSQEWSMTTFDQKSGGYPMWIFSSTGAWFYLAPGQWDEASRTLEWKSPPNLQVSHTTRCTFPDTQTIQCITLVKDARGRVLLEQETVSRKRG